MGPYQRTPKEVDRAIRYSGLGVRSVGPVGDFLDIRISQFLWYSHHFNPPLLQHPNKPPLVSLRRRETNIEDHDRWACRAAAEAFPNCKHPVVVHFYKSHRIQYMICIFLVGGFNPFEKS